MVIWIVGLSGVGKTTIAYCIRDFLALRRRDIMVVDGDEVRSVFQTDKLSEDYDLAARRTHALRMANLCQWIERQEKLVICAIQCVFDDIMLENRSRFEKYVQIELLSSKETLRSRDTKGLYKAYEQKNIKNVVGMDIEYSRPTCSDFIYHTDRNLGKLEIALDIIGIIESETYGL